ncbi:MAG: hypothetical protein ABI383_00125 [Acidobacteriaceae bacterium]
MCWGLIFLKGSKMENEQQKEQQQGKETKPEFAGGKTGGQTDSATGEKPGGGRPVEDKSDGQQKQNE